MQIELQLDTTTHLLQWLISAHLSISISTLLKTIETFTCQRLIFHSLSIYAYLYLSITS